MGLDTDGFGFPHPQELRGRVPARHCAGCAALVAKKPEADVLLPVAKFPRSKLGVNLTSLAPLCPKCHDGRHAL